MPPKVTIVIVNWNGLNDTIECLESLRSLTYPNYNIILVDNNSTNDEARELKNKFGSFIEEIQNPKNYGFAKGNNIGIKKALSENADLILLLNNDTIVKPDFLNNLVETSQKYNSGIVAPKILMYGTDKISSTGGAVKWFSRFIIQHNISPEHTVTKQDFLTGCCLLIKKEVFEKIGLLDELFFLYYEDADFCLRARKAGYKIMVSPESVIWHKISQTVKPESEKYHYYTNRNKLLFAKKNAPYLIFLYHYFRSCLTLLYIEIRLFLEKDINQITRLKAVQNGIKDFFKGKFYENSH